MRFRDQVALTLPALLLRLALCLIFLWAGLGKILGETTVTGEDAARLHAMGLRLTPHTPPAETPAAPPRALPDPNEDLPHLDPPTELIIPDNGDADDPQADENRTAAQGAHAVHWRLAQTVVTPPTAADFPDEHRVQRVYGIALLLSYAGNPGLTNNSEPVPPTMPAWVSADRWPVYFAWTAAGAELLAAAMLFFGVLTRFGAMIIIGIMLQAMWLTQIGPAMVGRVDSYLGFIPATGDPWAPPTFQTLFFQLACLTMATAVALLGSGPIGFDRALFRPPERLERTAPPPKQRSTFDRQPTDTP